MLLTELPCISLKVLKPSARMMSVCYEERNCLILGNALELFSRSATECRIRVSCPGQYPNLWPLPIRHCAKSGNKSSQNYGFLTGGQS